MDPLARKKRIIYITLMLMVALSAAGFYLWRSITPPAKEEPQGIFERIFGKIFGAPEPPPPPTTPPPGAIPPPPAEKIEINEQKKLLQLTSFAIISPSLDAKETRILFYKKEGGDMMASAFHSIVPEKLSHITIVGLLESIWAPTKGRALLRYLDGEEVKSFLHVGTSTVVLFPFNVQSFSWSPSGTQIAYTLRNGNGLDLVIADASGNNARTIFRTPLVSTHIQWVTADEIIFTTTPSSMAEGHAYIYRLSSGAFTKILGPLYGLMIRFSPNGTYALFSHVKRGGKNLTLSHYNTANGQSIDLGIATLPEKCAWAGTDTLYCAVPHTVADAQWPDQYLRGENTSSDKIVRIALKDNSTETVFDERIYDMQDLFITGDENILGFIDRHDGTLWRIKLK